MVDKEPTPTEYAQTLEAFKEYVKQVAERSILRRGPIIDIRAQKAARSATLDLIALAEKATETVPLNQVRETQERNKS